MDKFEDNLLLFGDGFSLKTLKNDAVELVVGNAMLSGYVNGAGTDVRLGYILDFLQLNEEEWLLVDNSNQCIRKMNRANKVVEDFAGLCSVEGSDDGIGSVDGIGLKASFSNPFGIVAHKYNEDLVIVTQQSALRT